MIEIKITSDTANDIMNDLFVLAAAWAKEPEKATEALEKAQPVSPMVKQFASPDGSNVKQCIKAEDFGTIKQKVAEFIQKDKAANSKALKQFLADHGSHKLSELDEKFIPDLQKLIEGDAIA